MFTLKDVHFSQENKKIKVVMPRCCGSFLSISEMEFPGRGQLNHSQVENWSRAVCDAAEPESGQGGSCLGLPLVGLISGDLHGGSDGKEFSCSAGDLGLIPGSGRSPGEGMATHSSILAWRIPWTEEPGQL